MSKSEKRSKFVRCRYLKRDLSIKLYLSIRIVLEMG